jgi:hypothetical protein
MEYSVLQNMDTRGTLYPVSWISYSVLQPLHSEYLVNRVVFHPFNFTPTYTFTFTFTSYTSTTEYPITSYDALLSAPLQPSSYNAASRIRADRIFDVGPMMISPQASIGMGWHWHFRNKPAGLDLADSLYPLNPL